MDKKPNIYENIWNESKFLYIFITFSTSFTVMFISIEIFKLLGTEAHWTLLYSPPIGLCIAQTIRMIRRTKT